VTAATDTELIAATAPVIKVSGAPLDLAVQNSLVALRVNLGLSTMGRATLRFVDPGYALAASRTFALGVAVEIGVTTTSVFKGVVTGASIEQSMTHIQELVVTVDDAAYKLNLAHRIASYEKVTIPDVISKLASLNGLAVEVPSDPTQHDYLLQRGSDLAFLESLTRRINCVWYVNDTKLVVKKAGGSDGAALKLRVADTLIDFSVRTSGLRPQQVQVNGWDSEQLDAIVQTDDSPDVGTDAPFAQGYKQASDLPVSSPSKIVVDESNPNTAGEAGTLATSLQTMWRSEAIVARGTARATAALKPYTKIVIDGNGPMDGEYLVNEIEHVYTSRGFFTKFVAGPVRPNLLVDSFGVTPRDPGFAYQGLVTAIVSDLGTDNDHIGMVKVKFAAWDKDLVSAWARVVFFGAGKSRGGVFLPEVGDEVLVGFERGDTRHPVVLGGLFGGQVPIAADSNAVQNGAIDYRRITSRTGHVIELGDGDADTKSHIKMALGKEGYLVRMGLDRFDIQMPAQKPFLIKVGDASIEIDAQGNISIKGMKISIEAQQDLTLKATTQLQAEGTAGISLKGATAELKGDGTATVESGGNTAIKGGMVMIN
jgi:phage protein D/phage baseplate assembly protein gpV